MLEYGVKLFQSQRRIQPMQNAKNLSFINRTIQINKKGQFYDGQWNEWQSDHLMEQLNRRWKPCYSLGNPVREEHVISKGLFLFEGKFWLVHNLVAESVRGFAWLIMSTPIFGFRFFLLVTHHRKAIVLYQRQWSMFLAGSRAPPVLADRHVLMPRA